MCRNLIAIGNELNSIWSPFVRRRLVRDIPESLSVRFAHFMVDRSASAAQLRRTLRPALERRRALRDVLSQGDETLEAIWEQEWNLLTSEQGRLEWLGAKVELEMVDALATHSELRPRTLIMLPDPRRTRGPDGLAIYDEIPDHLRGVGRHERLEITMVTSTATQETLAERVARAVLLKVSGRDGVSQLNSRLTYRGERIGEWGSVIVQIPDTGVTLSREVVERANHALFNHSRGNRFAQHPELYRYVVRQNNNWLSVHIGTDYTPQIVQHP